MTRLGTATLVGVLALGLAGLLAGDAATVGITGGKAVANPVWTPTKWPFPKDHWPEGLAYRCAPEQCGTEIGLYVRAKIGFCNCATGVSDDAELDRVGDLEIFSPKWVGLADGRQITVGWMSGRSRPFVVTMKYPDAPLTAIGIAFNDKCDVAVATVVAERDWLKRAEDMALKFLNTDTVLRWAEKALGI
jgi:hypothetical protein